ncbi:MAG: BamA/TamA family outer membrane protein [Bdellovibrionota bacterium]
MFADLYASHLRQILTLGYEWHAFDANRWYMKPLIEAKRIDEVDQEYYNFTGSYSLGTKRDFRPFHLEILSGPAGMFEDAQEGPSIGQKQFALWRNSIILNTHDYEVFMSDPRRGGRIAIESSSIIWGSAGNVNAHWLNIYGTKLWNLFNFGPPKYVFGVRFGAESVMTTENGDIRGSLPQSFFSWLGGDMNLRGFSRREIPFVSTGAQSAAYANFEIRFASLLMRDLDPFVFTDLGMYGLPNYNFNHRVYWSPGFGLRYQSPIGVVRGTMAHGFITGPGNPDHEHFQFFVSLGREF